MPDGLLLCPLCQEQPASLSLCSKSLILPHLGALFKPPLGNVGVGASLPDLHPCPEGPEVGACPAAGWGSVPACSSRARALPWHVRENCSGIHSIAIPADPRRSLLRELLLAVLELGRESENEPNHLKNGAGDTSTKCWPSQLLRD